MHYVNSKPKNGKCKKINEKWKKCQNHYSKHGRRIIQTYVWCYLKTMQISTKKGEIVQNHYSLQCRRVILTYVLCIFVLKTMQITSANQKVANGATPLFISTHNSDADVCTMSPLKNANAK